MNILQEASAEEVYQGFFATKMQPAEFAAVLETDPTAHVEAALAQSQKGKYTDWLLKSYLKRDQAGKQRFLQEDREAIHAGLEVLAKLTKNKEGLERLVGALATLNVAVKNPSDINSYTFEGIRALANAFTAEDAADAGTKDEKKIDVIINDSVMFCCVPKTHKASAKYGTGTSWCTAVASNDTYFKSYSSRGPLFIIIDKASPKLDKWQYHHESKSLMNAKDQAVARSTLIKHWYGIDEDHAESMSALAEYFRSIGYDDWNFDTIFAPEEHYDDLLRAAKTSIKRYPDGEIGAKSFLYAQFISHMGSTTIYELNLKGMSSVTSPRVSLLGFFALTLSAASPAFLSNLRQKYNASFADGDLAPLVRARVQPGGDNPADERSWFSAMLKDIDPVNALNYFSSTTPLNKAGVSEYACRAMDDAHAQFIASYQNTPLEIRCTLFQNVASDKAVFDEEAYQTAFITLLPELAATSPSLKEATPIPTETDERRAARLNTFLGGIDAQVGAAPIVGVRQASSMEALLRDKIKTNKVDISSRLPKIAAFVLGAKKASQSDADEQFAKMYKKTLIEEGRSAFKETIYKAFTAGRSDEQILERILSLGLSFLRDDEVVQDKVFRQRGFDVSMSHYYFRAEHFMHIEHAPISLRGLRIVFVAEALQREGWIKEWPSFTGSMLCRISDKLSDVSDKPALAMEPTLKMLRENYADLIEEANMSHNIERWLSTQETTLKELVAEMRTVQQKEDDRVFKMRIARAEKTLEIPLASSCFKLDEVEAGQDPDYEKLLTDKGKKREAEMKSKFRAFLGEVDNA